MFNTITTTSVIFSVLFLIHMFAVEAQADNIDIDYLITEPAVKWINGDITDSEFWRALSTMLVEYNASDSNTGNMSSTSSVSSLGSPLPLPSDAIIITEQVRTWIEDRTIWWLEGRITDRQFLDAVYQLDDAGYLDDQRSVPNGSTDIVSLEGILPTEKEIDAITKKSIWRFVKTEHNFDETSGVKSSIRILMKDINRVYDPIYGQYKIPTMSMQISQLTNTTSVNDYWMSYINQTNQEILASSDMIGHIDDNFECIFKYTDTGAVTICTLDKIIIQVIIFDMYNEHYLYKMSNIEIDKTEPTTYIMNRIIKKINILMGNNINSIPKLHNILEKNRPLYDNDTQNETSVLSSNITIENKTSQDAFIDHIINKTDTVNNTNSQEHFTDLERTSIYGVTGLLCMRDDFGVVTITGQYTNNHTPKVKIDVEISFVDWSGNIIGETIISFTKIDEFETRMFLGHVKWDKNFATCQISN